MRKIVLIRNPRYAEIISKADKGIVRTSESELLGIIPQQGDCYMIDAHFTGAYADLEGLKTVYKLIESFTHHLFKVELWSWFPEKYIMEHYHFTGRSNVVIKQFPG